MKNNRLDAMLRRDENAQLGLTTDQALYKPLEADIAPLRAAHAQNLEAAKALADEVFEADSDDSAAVKKGTRSLLKALAGRVARALLAHAASATNTDEDLAERVQASLEALRNTDSATFAQAGTAILAEATTLAAQLEKREVTAADFTEYNRLLTKFKKRLVTGRAADVKGKTARLAMTALLRTNAKLLKEIRRQLAPYKGTAREKTLLNFDAYSKLVVFNNGRGGAGDAPAA